MKFVNASGIPSNFVPPADYAFWELLNEAIQEEPSEGSDPTTLGLFASIGIEKGKPFNPDARMKKILTDAANIGSVTARAIAFRIRDKDAFFYPGSPWRLPFFGGYKFEVSPGVANLDGAAFFYYIATGVTPAMAEEMVGKGSQYPAPHRTPTANPSKVERPTSCACRQIFRSRISGQLSSMTTRRARWSRRMSVSPASAAKKKGVLVNEDGSVDVYFGPKAPAGKESNWVQTIPGKGWFMILRLYGPLEPWFDKTWKPGAIELVK